MVIGRPAGAAALRLDAAEVLQDIPSHHEPGHHVRPPRVIPFAMAAAAVIGLTGTGILPVPATVGLDLGALFCYLLALRAVLPPHSGHNRGWLSWADGMEPAVLALSAVLAGALLLASSPGMPWGVITPIWLLLMLTVCPWLEGGAEQQQLPAWGPTALACLIITVPAAFFVAAMTAGIPTPALAILVGLGSLAASWRMVRLTGRPAMVALERGAMVAVLMALAAVLTARLQVPGPLLPVALLVGWYGLTGVASLRDRRQLGAFATFVVLAAAILAIAAPA